MSQLSTFSSGSGGAGIQTIDGNSGSISGSTVTIHTVSEKTLLFSGDNSSTMQLLTTDGNLNVVYGFGNLGVVLGTPASNVIIGAECMGLNTGSPSQNVVVGVGAVSTTAGSYDNNVIIGYHAQISTTTNSSQNVVIGSSVAGEITSNNVIIGYGTAGNFSGSEGNNILVGANVPGNLGESNSIHIGDDGTRTKCYIGGITGVMVTGDAVLVDAATNQLGTATSSARYKDNIQDMADASDAIHNLRPVIFTMKSDESKQQQYGLIAEEVHKVMPKLVGLNKEGQINTVRYHELIPMLLNEIQKLRKEVDILRSK